MVSVLYWAHPYMKYSLAISSFLEEISSLSHSFIFLYFFALITERPSHLSLLFFGTLHSVWVYFSLYPLLFTSILFSAICKVSSDNHFAFLRLFFFEMVLVTASCTMYKPPSIVLQTLSTRSNPLNLVVISTV